MLTAGSNIIRGINPSLGNILSLVIASFFGGDLVPFAAASIRCCGKSRPHKIPLANNNMQNTTPNLNMMKIALRRFVFVKNH